jgi:2-oxo-4-hydroxy-4-carboxy--5-ureidoimidazoline (OHCU) decarboxylase
MTDIEQAACEFIAAHMARVESELGAERNEALWETEIVALSRLRHMVLSQVLVSCHDKREGMSDGEGR